MNRQVIGCVAAVISVLSAFVGEEVWARDIEFPSKVSSGDLTDPAVLPLDQRPTAADKLKFTSSPKDLTVSNTNEFMLGGLIFNTDRGSYKLTVSDVTTVKLPNSSKFGSRWMNVLYKGGTWDFCGTGDLYCNGTWNVGHYCTNVIDGATMTNINLFCVSDYNNEICLVMTNGAHVTAKDVQFSRDSTNLRRSTLIADGSTVTATSSFQASTDKDADSLTLVTGLGSRLSVPGTYFGSIGSNVGMRVEDGGEIEFRSSTEFDYVKVDNGNYVEVGNGGTFKAQDVNLAQSATSTNFEFRVLEGGLADFNQRPIRLYYNASVIVSNGTLLTGGVLADGGYNNRLRLVGPKTSFTWDKKKTSIYYLFSKGKNNAIELDDHAIWTPDIAFTWTVSSETNRLSLANGATMITPQLQLGYTTKGGVTHGNRIDVLSGAALSLTNRDFVAGYDNVVTVSNGTVHVTDLNLGQTSGRRNRIALQGTTPRFYTDGYLYLSGTDPTLAFDLSDGPIVSEEGKAPLQVGGVFYVISESFLFKVSGLEALSQKLSSKTTFPLFRFKQEWDSVTLARLDAALAAENAALEAEFGARRHVLSRTGFVVSLTSKPSRRGLTILLR